jgi:hypothetical protein
MDLSDRNTPGFLNGICRHFRIAGDHEAQPGETLMVLIDQLG